MVGQGGDPVDLRSRYCRRLGHEVPFRYCRSTADGSPCGSLSGCWRHVAGMEAAVAEAAAVPPAAGPVDKRLQLAELIRRARSA